MAFLHGIEVKRIDNNKRPIEVVSTSVIGLVGTATANTVSDTAFPYNKPFLITNKTEASALGTAGTIPTALDAIFDQAGATVVCVRVQKGTDDAATLSNLIGGTTNDVRTGVECLLDAQSLLGVKPKILTIPNFTHEQALLEACKTVAESLRAIIIADCNPEGTYSDAITFRNLFGSERIILHYPSHTYFDTNSNQNATRSAAPSIAGLLAKVDRQQGWWASPSNKKFNGVLAPSKPIDFQQGDENSRANLLNSKQISCTVVNQGKRLWGDYTTSSDMRYRKLNVVRIQDTIDESIQNTFSDFLDRGITKNFIGGIVESTNNFLTRIKTLGAIYGGKAWVDSSLNTADVIAQNQVVISFDFTPVYTAERITFNSHLTNDYISQLFTK